MVIECIPDFQQHLKLKLRQRAGVESVPQGLIGNTSIGSLSRQHGAEERGGGGRGGAAAGRGFPTLTAKDGEAI